VAPQCLLMTQSALKLHWRPSLAAFSTARHRT
jgi:hypothetical protein